MARELTARERKRAATLAREYADRGYRVVREPRGEDLPAFLRPFEPDLVAYGDEESVVVEVKSEESLAGESELPSLAEIIERQPGWRLELVVTNPRHRPLKEDPSSKGISWDRIEEQVRATELLVAEQRFNEASLLAWALGEATLREAAIRQGIQVDDLDAVSLLKTTYSFGVLDRAGMKTLEELLEARNRTAHAGAGPPAGLRLLSAALDLVRRLRASADFVATLKRRLWEDPSFRETVKEGLRDAASGEILQYLPLGGEAAAEAINEQLDELHIGNVDVGAVIDVLGTDIVVEMYAEAHVVASFLVDPDHISELDDVEVVNREAAEHAAQVSAERHVIAEFSVAFDMQALVMGPADLVDVTVT